MVVAELLDASELVGLPDHCEEVLNPPDGHSILCLAFNPAGTLLATGCIGGVILIWDYQTRGLIRTWKTDSSANVLSVLWTSNGRQLISGDEAGRLLLWDVVSGQVQRTLLSGDLPPITRIQYGTGSGQFLLSFRMGPAAVVALDSRKKAKITMLPFPGGAPRTPEDEDVIASREGEDGTRMANGDGPSNSSGPKPFGQAVVGKPGLQVLIASTRGALLVLRARDLAIIDAVRVPASLRVNNLELDSNGSRVLVLMSDKTLRVHEIGLDGRDLPSLLARSPDDIEALLAQRVRKPAGSLFFDDQNALLQLTRKFEQQIERKSWGSASFTADGEFVLASVSGKEEHIIYFWNAHYGHTDRILECLRECQGVQAMVWHPKLYPMQLLTLGGSGSVYIWAKILSDRWTAFAPDFRELEENEEYIEREDEFDLNADLPGSNGTEEPMTDPSIDEPIDIITSSAGIKSPKQGDLQLLPIIIQPAQESTTAQNPQPVADEA